jgi:hypothetical protein
VVILTTDGRERTTFAALARTERPLQACEVHAAAEELAATSLSWNTVKDCLHKNARRPTSPIERTRHGLYRHRQAPRGDEAAAGVAARVVACAYPAPAGNEQTEGARRPRGLGDLAR